VEVVVVNNTNLLVQVEVLVVEVVTFGTSGAGGLVTHLVHLQVKVIMVVQDLSYWCSGI
jgi:hypothetical protein